MVDSQNPRRILRGIGAVLAGILVNALLSLGTDEILHLAGFYPPWGQPTAGNPLIVATAYRIVYGIAGCYVTARLAPIRPMLHALIGGAVGVVLSSAGAAATWNLGLGPHWYSLALIATAIPCAWAGGKLRLMQLNEQARA